MDINVIITGATGLVGEGVVLECLSNPSINKVLIVNRKASGMQHAKLTELLVPDFFKLEEYTTQLTGYNACFYCAGISSLGMKEPEYNHITYDTTLHFARVLLQLNPSMVFGFISGAQTDSTEAGSIMWARVKGKTENALAQLPFKAVYNFRPGLMKPTEGQKNIRGYYKVISFMYPFFKLIMPGMVSTVQQLALAMINSVQKGYSKTILEVKDIKELAKG